MRDVEHVEQLLRRLHAEDRAGFNAVMRLARLMEAGARMRRRAQSVP